ncbi:MAG: ThuA domain-containing protein [Thermoguttaceae bacterium]|nr:ThuA domain-containing protein [Thermoguttaceae bacterium]
MRPPIHKKLHPQADFRILRLSKMHSSSAPVFFSNETGSFAGSFAGTFAGLSVLFLLLFGSLFPAPLYAQIDPMEITSGKADLSAINVLLIDGRGTHNWRETTPVLERTLEETGLFDVTVATAPEEWEDIRSFQPDFSQTDVVLLNYCGEKWSDSACDALLRFVAQGGGLVLCHSANFTFPDWPEFQPLLGVSGWNGRTSAYGPYRYWEPGRGGMQYGVEGPAGSVSKMFEYQIHSCEPNHPIMRGLPLRMLHGPDELYAHLRGVPSNAPNVRILAATPSPAEDGGSGRMEIQLMTVTYGQGRIFQIFYGHAGNQCRSVAFIVPFLRGTQWAATGTVTIPIPEDIPTPEKSYHRP